MSSDSIDGHRPQYEVVQTSPRVAAAQAVDASQLFS